MLRKWRQTWDPTITHVLKFFLSTLVCELSKYEAHFMELKEKSTICQVTRVTRTKDVTLEIYRRIPDRVVAKLHSTSE